MRGRDGEILVRRRWSIELVKSNREGLIVVRGSTESCRFDLNRMLVSSGANLGLIYVKIKPKGTESLISSDPPCKDRNT